MFGMSYIKCPGDSDSNHNLHSFKLYFVTEMLLSQPCRANSGRSGPALSGAVWQPRELGYTSRAPQPPQRRPGRQGNPTEALRALPRAALACSCLHHASAFHQQAHLLIQCRSLGQLLVRRSKQAVC